MKTGISESGLNVTKDRFLALRVPVAPIEEQRRVVEILEDHLSRLDAGERSLKSAERRGELLELAWLDALVPEGTPSMALKDVAHSSGYGTSTKCIVDGPGAPVVRIPNVAGGRIDLTDEKRAADPEIDLSSLMLRTGDLLFVRTNGSKDLIGRTAVVQPGVDAAFASYLIRYQLNPSLVDPQWVHQMMRRPAARHEIERRAASSAGQYNLSLGKLDAIPIPLPHLDTQRRLLANYESAADGPRVLLREAEKVRRRLASLRRALLSAAFSGKLTGSATDIERVEMMAGV
jgi:type I restriction enzyme S subunit